MVELPDELDLHQHHQHIPGLDNEPLEPFLDDVFGGMDDLWSQQGPGPVLLDHDSAAGLGNVHIHPHDLMQGPNLHFPALDCSISGSSCANHQDLGLSPPVHAPGAAAVAVAAQQQGQEQGQQQGQQHAAVGAAPAPAHTSDCDEGNASASAEGVAARAAHEAGIAAQSWQLQANGPGGLECLLKPQRRVMNTSSSSSSPATTITRGELAAEGLAPNPAGTSCDGVGVANGSSSDALEVHDNANMQQQGLSTQGVQAPSSCTASAVAAAAAVTTGDHGDDSAAQPLVCSNSSSGCASGSSNGSSCVDEAPAAAVALNTTQQAAGTNDAAAATAAVGPSADAAAAAGVPAEAQFETEATRAVPLSASSSGSACPQHTGPEDDASKEAAEAAAVLGLVKASTTAAGDAGGCDGAVAAVPAAGSGGAAAATAAASAAAVAAAVSPSDGSVPDIDDVLDDEPPLHNPANTAHTQQQEDVHAQACHHHQQQELQGQQEQQVKARQGEHDIEAATAVLPKHNSVSSSSSSSRSGGDGAQAAQQDSGAEPTAVTQQTQQHGAAGMLPSRTGTALGDCVAQQPTPAEAAAGAEAAAEAEAAPAAGAASGSDAATADSEQQLSVHGDDFASPCSSWHSCVTAASKASSMASSTTASSSRRAFGGGVAAPCSDAAAAATMQQQQLASPVSSLHLALKQQQQQQTQSAGSGRVLRAAAIATGGSCVIGAAAADVASSSFVAAHLGAAAASAATTSPLAASGAPLSPSAPIAVQQPPGGRQQQQWGQHQGDEELWQSVSPPNFGWSPPTMVAMPPPPPAAQRAAVVAGQAPLQPGAAAVATPGSTAAQTVGSNGTMDAIDEAGQAAGGPAVGADAAAAAAGLAAAATAAGLHDGNAADGAAAPPSGLHEGEHGDCDDVGHAHYYAASTASSVMGHGSLMQHLLHLEQLQHLLPPHHHNHLAATSSQMQLRQSELVDLSLSTSVHPSQLQQQHLLQQQLGWLTAHQQLPPAAAQAVERAVVALNESYYFHARPCPSELLGSASAAVAAAGAGAGSQATAAAAAAGTPGLPGAAAAIPAAVAAGGSGLGLVGRGLRRPGGTGQQWSKGQTQPQQDQQARHRLPSTTTPAHAGGAFGWPGAAVLGDWFSSTVQQPLAAVASRAAVGVGHRLGAAAAGLGGAVGVQQQHHHRPAHHLQQQPPPHGASRAGRMAGSGSSSGSVGVGVGVGGAGADASTAGRIGDGPVGSLDAAGGVNDDDAVLVEKTPDLPQSEQEQEDEAFRGLLFLGGRDSHGRPVVIINTDAIPAGNNSAPRDAALDYLLKRLGPVVTRGPYVLIVVALHSGPQFRLLPGVWCVRAYQSLPRAFRKHVKHVILLQPSLMIKAAVTLLWPFVSSKAHAKVKQVQRLLDIDAATGGEVQVPHLGEHFLTTLATINNRRRAEAEAGAASPSHA